jgi:hypothetical protein
MNHSELLETRANTPAPKPPQLTSAKIDEAELLRLEVEAFIASGGSYEVIEDNTKCRSMTAKEQMNANYKKDVLNGKAMDTPIKPKR